MPLFFNAETSGPATSAALSLSVGGKTHSLLLVKGTLANPGQLRPDVLRVFYDGTALPYNDLADYAAAETVHAWLMSPYRCYKQKSPNEYVNVPVYPCVVIPDPTAHPDDALILFSDLSQTTVRLQPLP